MDILNIEKIEEEVEALVNDAINKMAKEADNDAFESLVMCLEFITKYENMLSKQFELMQKQLCDLKKLLESHSSEISRHNDNPHIVSFLKYIFFAYSYTNHMPIESDSVFLQSTSDYLDNTIQKLIFNSSKIHNDYFSFLRTFYDVDCQKLNETIKKVNSANNQFGETWSRGTEVISSDVKVFIEKISEYMSKVSEAGESIGRLRIKERGVHAKLQDFREKN